MEFSVRVAPTLRWLALTIGLCSLAAYKVPKRVEFREALPKSAIGKLLRRELAREFRAAHGSA